MLEETRERRPDSEVRNGTSACIGRKEEPPPNSVPLMGCLEVLSCGVAGLTMRHSSTSICSKAHNFQAMEPIVCTSRLTSRGRCPPSMSKLEMDLEG